MRVGTGARLTALVLAACISGPANAQDGEVERGEAIAQEWCAACHALPGSKVASDAAPALVQAISGKDLTAGALRAWLSTPHPQMPDFNLAREEVDALIAYLRGLGR
ncbi:c-type cytochrome [Ferruginivarius sediminum]|uniref:Cytochrome c n=1 Tax=Ferruginivarius sediminum TaxID=2661937 RepID=A0A369T7N8_9PROT|nr:cytochrome c [Ferruginivarius sediminum]RDD61320.1 cytochrome c [Ferruginivarius sediminum]